MFEIQELHKGKMKTTVKELGAGAVEKQLVIAWYNLQIKLLK